MCCLTCVSAGVLFFFFLCVVNGGDNFDGVPMGRFTRSFHRQLAILYFYAREAKEEIAIIVIWPSTNNNTHMLGNKFNSV